MLKELCIIIQTVCVCVCVLAGCSAYFNEFKLVT